MRVVRTIIENHEGGILFLKRSKGTYREQEYCFPGGKLEGNDSLEETALRELEEETGIKARKLEYLFKENVFHTAL